MSALLTYILALVISFAMSFGSGAFTNAQAKWFGKDKKVETGEIAAPPDTATIEEECGPIREKIGKINNSNPVAVTLQIPRREWLLAKNKRCMQKWGQQEFDYLRSVDVKPKSQPVLGADTSPAVVEPAEETSDAQ